MILPKSLSMFRVPYHIWKLKQSQYKKAKYSRMVQSKKLRKMVEHAYSHVPYYHSLFKTCGIKPGDIRSAEDLPKLPAIGKSEFLENWGNFVSNTTNLEKCKVFATSGTTGTPLHIVKDRITEDIGYALTYYSFFECNMSLRDRFFELTVTDLYSRKHTFRHGPCKLMKGYYVSVFNDPAAIVEEALKVKPDVIYCFPSAIEYLLEDFGKEMRKLNPKLLFSQGEKLNEKCRKLIQDNLGLTPNDTYGSREFSGMAFECNEHQGLHVLDDWIVLELARDGEVIGPGEQGETLVTSLYNYSMPLIRYRLGDLAQWKEDRCTCGRNWPLLETLEGRVMDVITLPSGRRILGTVLGAYLRIHGIKRYQIIFEQSKAKMLIKLICDNNIQEKDLENFRQRIIHQIRLACLNEPVDIEVSFVSHIPPQPSGKNPDLIVKK